MIDPAERMNKIKGHFFAEQANKISELKSLGKEIIRLDIGSPDSAPAPFIVERLQRQSFAEDHHGYQPHKGTPQLRDAWAKLYLREYGVQLDPESEILPLIGSKEGIFHLMQAYIQDGDIALVPDPAYLSYEQAVIFAGGEIKKLPITQDNNYLPDLESIDSEIIKKTKVIWINYPNNPTTALATMDFFNRIVKFGEQNNILVCHDAAYTQVTFTRDNAPSILKVESAKNTAIEFNSLSKSHNMAGWRTGVLVGNAEIIKTAFILKSNIDSGHFLPIIEGSVTAMTGDQTWKITRNEKYRQRRDVVISYLNKLGLEAAVPQATIYIWCRVPDGYHSLGFVNEVLDNTGVCFAPGSIFGQYGEGFIRIALVKPLNVMLNAMEKFKDWMEK